MTFAFGIVTVTIPAAVAVPRPLPAAPALSVTVTRSVGLKPLPRIVNGPPDELGERLVRVLLTMTSDVEGRESIVGMMRAAMTNDQALVMIREFITDAILGRVVEALGVSPLRMEAVFAQMSGLILARHIIRLEPLASADIVMMF